MWRLAILGPVLLAGCRDATSPFQATDRIDESASLPRQLTFASADDRGPTWDSDGASILYSTEGFPPFVEAPGLLLRVPSGGGAAEPLLPALQFPGGPRDWLSSPVRSPSGARLAWVELWGVSTPNVCPGTGVSCSPQSASDGLGPLLTEVRVRVRSEQAGQTVVSVPLDGVEALPAGGGLTRFATRFHPFQAVFQLEGSAVFRPSWDPAGDRLVISDGLRLLIWSADGTPPAPVPGTEDGVQAAWSPDGEWIAFTRLVRGAPVQIDCTHSVPLGPVCSQERVEWPIVDRIVSVVRPDGSELRDLTPGDDPAWRPGGEGLVFRRDGALWTVAVDGSGAVRVPGSEGGREPAVSPDGRTVVYARIDPRFMTHDLWVASLDGEGS